MFPVVRCDRESVRIAVMALDTPRSAPAWPDTNGGLAMRSDDLTTGDRALIALLMAIGTEVPNAELTNKYGVKVDKARRDKLVKQKLLEVRTDESRRIHITLIDRGWQCGRR